MFILDNSEFIRVSNPSDESHDNWELMLNFVVDFVSKIKIGPSDNQVGLVVFSHTGERRFYLDEHTDKISLIEVLSDQVYDSGQGRNFAAGLREMRSQFAPEHGDRDDAENVAILLVGGKSTVSSDQVSEVESAIEAGIKVFVVGVQQGGGERQGSYCRVSTDFFAAP